MVSTFQPFFGHMDKDGTNGNVSSVAPVRVPDVLPRKKRILHVEFDRILLTTRHVLLETAGFEVVSCFSGMAAREVSTGNMAFDVFLVGHAAPMDERGELITWMRAQFPGISIIALRSRDTDFSPASDATTIPDPDELLKTIMDVLKVR